MRLRTFTSRGCRVPATLPLVVLFALMLPGPSTLAGQEKEFPFSLGSESWVVAPAGLGLTILGFGLVRGSDRVSMEEIRGLSPGDVNAFDRIAAKSWSPSWGDRSDLSRLGVYGAGILLVGGGMIRAVADGRSRNALELGGMLGEVSALTAGVTYMAKALSGRKRPYLFNAELTPEERLDFASSNNGTPTQSFFSGHASSTFAVAVFVSTVFTEIHGRGAWSDLVWGTTLSLATYTAAARVKSGMHFPSDVLVGAVVGSGIGYLVPQLHKKDEVRLLTPDAVGFQLGYTFRF